MSSINQIAQALTTITESTTKKTNNNNSNQNTVAEKPSDTLSINQESHTYKPDIEKINNMKAETDQRMIDLFTNTVSHGFLKQLGGLRGALEKILKGEKVEGLDIQVTEENILKAKEDVAPGGYWSPESTSDRLLEFAKALSGDDPSKAKMLTDAVKKGFELAKEVWGDELPEISKKTYDLTLEKFENWEKSSNNNE